jgi:L-ascorbate metabolism protein UlaG (beta-lactamase superfamily)
MKITRYTQSCLLVEGGDSRILFDASGDEKANQDKFGKLDAVIYTHEHGDHFDAGLAKAFAEQGVSVYTNASTAKLINAKVNIIADGQQLQLGSFNIKAIELPHCLLPDGNQGPQNTGYLLNNKLFNPGDGKELTGLKVEILVLPITGPDISMKDCFDFAKQVGCKHAVAVHYDKIGANPQVYASFAERFDFPFQIVVLEHGSEIEL